MFGSQQFCLNQFESESHAAVHVSSGRGNYPKEFSHFAVTCCNQQPCIPHITRHPSVNVILVALRWANGKRRKYFASSRRILMVIYGVRVSNWSAAIHHGERLCNIKIEIIFARIPLALLSRKRFFRPSHAHDLVPQVRSHVSWGITAQLFMRQKIKIRASSACSASHFKNLFIT